MKKINLYIEFPVTIFCAVFLSNLLCLFFSLGAWNCALSAVISVGLLSLYRLLLRPRIENALSGTYCESTQKDAYRLEDESEETQVES